MALRVPRKRRNSEIKRGNESFSDRYVSSGATCDVYEVRNIQTDDRWAEKRIDLSVSINREIVEHEIQVLQEIKDIANVVKFISADEININGRNFYIIKMEYLSGQDLRSTISNKEKLKDNFGALSDICETIFELEKKEIVHRDIKPGNIVLEKAAKLIDFGLAYTPRRIDLGNSKNVFGTVEYMSPEQARGRVQEHSSDIFSLAFVAYHAMMGDVPFCSQDRHKILHLIKRFDGVSWDGLLSKLKEKNYSDDIVNAFAKATYPVAQARVLEPLHQEMLRISKGGSNAYELKSNSKTYK